MTQVALYARVSTDIQAQTDTIASQISALENRIAEDGYTLLGQLRFIDNGFSGSKFESVPDLENYGIRSLLGKLIRFMFILQIAYSRKYAYQMILLEEFQNAGADVVFLNFQANDNPESQLLLQMQGMIAEYERTKILERSRRGKIGAAKKGLTNVFRRVLPMDIAILICITEGVKPDIKLRNKKLKFVRKMFHWVGYERLSISKVRHNLLNLNIPSPKGNPHWNNASIYRILRSPTYKGQAAYGKTKRGPRLPVLRPQKNATMSLSTLSDGLKPYSNQYI